MPLTLRPPFNLPPAPDPTTCPARVAIRHPAYERNPTLVEFDAVDTDKEGRPGVMFAVAHTSAAIIANNEFQGWLSTKKIASEGKIELAAGDVLTAGIYYFHVPSSREKNATSGLPDLNPYPVVPSFRHWCFPPTLPSYWDSADIGVSRSHRDVVARDESCLITRHQLVTSIAHIVPATEVEWFVSNEMNRFRTYTPEGQSVIDKPENLLLLRQDLHFAWDRMDFSLLPKQDSNGSWVWTLHAHTLSTDELHTLYHNRVLHTFKGVSRQFLFARFAWDIFPRLRSFLSAGVSRRIKTSLGVNDCSPDDIRSLCEGEGRNRSLSPRKGSSTTKRQRQRSDIVETDTQSFDSGVGGMVRQSNSPEGDEFAPRCETNGDYWHKASDVVLIDERKSLRCKDEYGWLLGQNLGDKQDTYQDELDEWKVQNGLISSERWPKRNFAYDGTPIGIEERRGRKRFRS